MKLWIRTQDKTKIIEVDNIVIKKGTLKTLDQRYPFGVLLGKFKDHSKAQAVLDTIFARFKTAGRDDCIFEVPEDF